MSRTITVDIAGRIVLPVDIRRRLNLSTGSRLTLDVVAERIELTPEPEAGEGLQSVPGQRTVLKPTGQPFDAASAVRVERDSQVRRGAGRAGRK